LAAAKVNNGGKIHIIERNNLIGNPEDINESVYHDDPQKRESHGYKKLKWGKK
jgi:hypothetical protein